MKTPEQTAREIFGERAAFYTTSSTHADPQVLARVVELAAPQADWSALDVATGTGHTAFALASHVARVVGTDLTPQMLAEGKKLAQERDVANVRFCLADVHALPFDDGAFHVVTCRRAAHHFSDIARALREMRRVLCKGARLVIDDRSVPEDDFVDERMNHLDCLHDESHVRQYRPSAWTRMLTQAGFAVESVELYTKHRPLTSLTDGVSTETVQRIHAIVGGLNDDQRKTLNLVEKEGQLYLNHWYILLSASLDFIQILALRSRNIERQQSD
jgi:ubiquinone/menaquinone biosynthesis C-methylase UbiE